MQRAYQTKLDKFFDDGFRKGNYGYAEVVIDDLPDTSLFVNSSIQDASDIPDIVCKPTDSPFTAFSVGKHNNTDPSLGNIWPRDVDCEYKLLSKIADMLGDNFEATGTVTLYTELELV